jgi:hypothetical protein
VLSAVLEISVGVVDVIRRMLQIGMVCDVRIHPQAARLRREQKLRSTLLEKKQARNSHFARASHGWCLQWEKCPGQVPENCRDGQERSASCRPAVLPSTNYNCRSPEHAAASSYGLTGLTKPHLRNSNYLAGRCLTICKSLCTPDRAHPSTTHLFCFFLILSSTSPTPPPASHAHLPATRR